MNQIKDSFKKWVTAAVIRAIRTFFQAALAAIPTTVTLMQEVNWPMVVSTAALAAVLSVMTSIATGLPEVEEKG